MGPGWVAGWSWSKCGGWALSCPGSVKWRVGCAEADNTLNSFVIIVGSCRASCLVHHTTTLPFLARPLTTLHLGILNPYVATIFDGERRGSEDGRAWIVRRQGGAPVSRRGFVVGDGGLEACSMAQPRGGLLAGNAVLAPARTMQQPGLLLHSCMQVRPPLSTPQTLSPLPQPPHKHAATSGTPPRTGA